MSPISSTDSTTRATSSTDEGGVSALGTRRGRRPVETPTGEPISNRRRMQNRMAQRAYRQRKESAIDVLKQKVEELEKSKENMGKEFLNFTNVILEQDTLKNNPDIVEHIKKSTISILTSAREVENDGPNSPDNEDPDPITTIDDTPAEVSTDYVLSTDQINALDFPMMDYVPQLDFDNLVDYGYTTNTEPTPIPEYNSTPSAFDTSSYCQMPINQTPQYNMYQLPGASWDSSLCCPRSYASQEATFGRRYQRASQEAAFLLASMRHSPPSWYKKVFGFCMHFETREEISKRIGETVSKSRDATLNNWRFPFTNVGGAGLFYPEHGNGTDDLPIGNRYMQNEAYMPSEMSGFSMGPFGPSIEQTRDLRLNPQLRIIDPNYDGDFFDADEIEICLRGYGVTIPANKDFVTAYIDMGMFERAEARGIAEVQNDGPVTPPDASNDATNILDQDEEALSADPLSLHCPTGLMGMAMGAMPPPPKPQPQEQWKTPTKRDTKVKVDVERLITCLCNATVCLGRTPAVRPKDIRKALKMSLVDED
ncbi:uncharacterized protein B0J16DRAFT_371854 [Fusarium flagelliforme]|uniref:uncharacterized protein n=1 Tax=Fusarium flagelliforme TaxID=2675880 RepID=UPI001E8E6B94|nr:uncharacterized protein B0J16DRAFT_371854 [Fusarium flagelliforme]KAH7184976.1 hypothetical protein B0J16DRAFT_371854 [Fusarium flagelliforme]